MENASKALLIAGAVLIALLIISALVFMFRNITDYQKDASSIKSEKQITEFNKSYTSFEKDLRGNELLSLINKAVDYNERNVEDGYTPITINFEVKDEYTGKTNATTIRVKKGNYSINAKEDTFSTFMSDMQRIEREYKGDKYLQRLIALNIDASQGDAKKIAEINELLKDINSSLTYNTSVKKDIADYDEYVQFKRKKFTFLETVYDGEQAGTARSPYNGRIVEMYYEEKE